jgi:prophage maintenance system killer protein
MMRSSVSSAVLQVGDRAALSTRGVDAAVQVVKNSYYQTVEELAAAYEVYLVQGHLFLDGNRRAGAAAMLTFLEANIDLHQRSEAGDDASRLIADIAAPLADRRVKRKRLSG